MIDKTIKCKTINHLKNKNKVEFSVDKNEVDAIDSEIAKKDIFISSSKSSDSKNVQNFSKS